MTGTLQYIGRTTWSLEETAMLLAGKSPGDPMAMLIADPTEGGWPAHIYANLKDAVESGELPSKPSRTGRIADTRVTPWEAIQWAKKHGYKGPAWQSHVRKPKPEPSPTGEPSSTTGPHASDKLATLIQAARKFWANADRDDRTTHPTNDEVAKWLEDHGFSARLAKSGATIIRPEWAGTGRKPEE